MCIYVLNVVNESHIIIQLWYQSGVIIKHLLTLFALFVDPQAKTQDEADTFAYFTWWHHQMETSAALMAICAGTSLMTREFPAQRPVTRSFDFFFICVWINSWVNNREAGYLRHRRAHYDVTLMIYNYLGSARKSMDGNLFIHSDIFTDFWPGDLHRPNVTISTRKTI